MHEKYRYCACDSCKAKAVARMKEYRKTHPEYVKKSNEKLAEKRRKSRKDKPKLPVA